MQAFATFRVAPENEPPVTPQPPPHSPAESRAIKALSMPRSRAGNKYSLWGRSRRLVISRLGKSLLHSSKRDEDNHINSTHVVSLIVSQAQPDDRVVQFSAHSFPVYLLIAVPGPGRYCFRQLLDESGVQDARIRIVVHAERIVSLPLPPSYPDQRIRHPPRRFLCFVRKCER